MSETLEFVLHGKIGGVEITPSTINFSQFNEFNQQVEQFIAGRTGGKLDTVRVEIKKSSYGVAALMAASLAVAVDDDMDRMAAREDSLGDVDQKRAEVVRKWQLKASANDELYVEVRSSLRQSRGLPPLRISDQTNYRIGERAIWVAVEKYLFGSVEEMGGSTNSNVHLRIPGMEKIVLVDSDKDSIKGRGVLYENVLLHVRAKENAKTGELKDVKLLEFVDYKPQYDEAALDRFAEAGKAAWSNISDGDAWLRELRGDSSQ
jgi:hypothetical protein